MTRETVDASIALLMADGAFRSRTSIRLGSGEPLLGLPQLRYLEARLAEIREQLGLVPRVFLTTNGMLAGPEVRDWLVRSGWHVKVSLDGPAAVHDRWRVSRRGSGTHRVVSEVVTDLARRMPERFSVTAVLCHGTDPAEVFDGIEVLGVRRIELVPAVHSDPGIVPDSADIALYRVFAREWVRRYVAAVEPSRDGSSATRPAELTRLVNSARRVMGYDRSRVSCSAGRTFVGIDAVGRLYPCFRFIGLDDYQLGELASGVDEERAARFRVSAGRPYDQRSACRSCDVAPLCGGPCFATAELNGPGGGEPYPLQCQYVRIDAEGAIELVEQLRAINPELLLGMLPLPPGAIATLERLR